jgi:hypothetical protein
LFYPVNARVVDFTLTLSALLRRKTQTQSSAWLWWTTADFSRALSGQFSALENSRKICARTGTDWPDFRIAAMVAFDDDLADFESNMKML